MELKDTRKVDKAAVLAYANKLWRDIDPELAAEVEFLPEPLRSEIRRLLDQPMGQSTRKDIEALSCASRWLVELTKKRAAVGQAFADILSAYGPRATIGDIMPTLPASVQEILAPRLYTDTGLRFSDEECDRLLAALSRT